jgi:hypothetical protein
MHDQGGLRRPGARRVQRIRVLRHAQLRRRLHHARAHVADTHRTCRATLERAWRVVFIMVHLCKQVCDVQLTGGSVHEEELGESNVSSFDRGVKAVNSVGLVCRGGGVLGVELEPLELEAADLESALGGRDAIAHLAPRETALGPELGCEGRVRENEKGPCKKGSVRRVGSLTRAIQPYRCDWRGMVPDNRGVTGSRHAAHEPPSTGKRVV